MGERRSIGEHVCVGQVLKAWKDGELVVVEVAHLMGNANAAELGALVATFPTPEGYVTIRSLAEAFSAEQLRDALRLKTGSET